MIFLSYKSQNEKEASLGKFKIKRGTFIYCLNLFSFFKHISVFIIQLNTHKVSYIRINPLPWATFSGETGPSGSWHKWLRCLRRWLMKHPSSSAPCVLLTPRRCSLEGTVHLNVHNRQTSLWDDPGTWVCRTARNRAREAPSWFFHPHSVRLAEASSPAKQAISPQCFLSP